MGFYVNFSGKDPWELLLFTYLRVKQLKDVT